MKFIPFLTAIIVIVTLYMFVFERDSLVDFAQTSSPVEAEDAAVETETADATEEVMESPEATDLVKVVAMASEATNVDSAVILRGRTEAAREVTVAAETSGLGR